MVKHIGVIAVGVLLLAIQTNAVNYYVNSATGSDATTNNGSIAKPWKSLVKVSGSAISLKPGDNVFLDGSFTGNLSIDLYRSFGNLSRPVTIQSLNASRPATIRSSTVHAIRIYDGTSSTTVAKGLFLVIKDLILIGSTTTTTAVSAISLTKSGTSAVSGLTISNVNGTNFTQNGITISRASSTAGYVNNIIISKCHFSNIRGLSTSGGSGLNLAGVRNVTVQGCSVANSGAASTSTTGPSAYIVNDADRVTISGSVAFGTLSKGTEGNGFVFDSKVNNSVIEFCTSYNNTGPGYKLASRTAGANLNNIIRFSTSNGDGNGVKWGSVFLSSDVGSILSGAQIFGNIITVTDPAFCDLWGNKRDGHWGLWMSGGNITATWTNNTVTCGNDGAVFNSDLTCSTPTNNTPTCVVSPAGPALPYRPFTYYVNAVSGNDTRDGRSAATAWKTLDQVSNWNWGRYPFKAGDKIILSGNFTTKLYLALSKSYGSAADPITITSLDPNNRATISPVNGDHAISIYDSASAPAKGLGIKIMDLNLVGRGILDPAGRPGAGIFVWKEGNTTVDGLIVTRVNITAFTLAGLATSRAPTAGFITGVSVTDSMSFWNKGFANITRPIGGGFSLGGVDGALVERCVAFKNGELNNNPSGGPVGFWAYDSNNVTFRNCTSFDNLSSRSDGSGFDLDLAVNNSMIENCTAYNNHGAGFQVNTGKDYYSNNNNTVRFGTSVGDGWGTGYASVSVWNAPGSSKIFGLQIYGMDVVVIDPDVPCGFWGSDSDTHYGFWMWGNHSDTRWFNNKVTCNNNGTLVEYSDNLVCSTIGGGTTGTGRSSCAALEI